MDVKEYVQFLKPFFDAAKDVFTTMVHTPITIGKPYIKKDISPLGDVTALIGMSGHQEKGGEINDFQGQFCISFQEETYIKVASAMLMEEYTEFNEEIADVGSEICNIIVGNTKGGLVELGCKIEMAIPNMIRGKNHQISYPAEAMILVVPVECNHGKLFMEICFRGLL